MFALKLRLTLQDFQRRLGSKLWAKVLLAEAKGESIFEIQSTLLLEKGRLREFSPGSTLTLGRYDLVNDIEIIYFKRIEDYCKRYSLDSDAVLFNTICHEIGHAKEARLFEREGLFGDRFRIHGGNYPIKINSRTYFLNRDWNSNFYETFLTGIQDYAVDAELRKSGIETPLPRFEVENLRKNSQQNIDKDQLEKLSLQALLFLPHRVNLFVNGGIAEREKAFLKEYNTSLLGDKWKLAKEKMENLKLGNSKGYVDVVCTLFERILEQKVFLRTEDSRIIFDTCKRRPEIWTKKDYKIFYLAPRDIGETAQAFFSWFDHMNGVP